MASLDRDLAKELAEVAARLSKPTEVTPEQVLENLDKAEQRAIEYTESPEENAQTLKKINEYRLMFGASDDIKNTEFIRMIAENELLPDRPTHDDRTVFQIGRDVFAAVDEKYLSWTYTRTGRLIFFGIVALFLGWAIYPGAAERISIRSEGYQACKYYSELGRTCP